MLPRAVVLSAMVRGFLRSEFEPSRAEKVAPGSSLPPLRKKDGTRPGTFARGNRSVTTRNLEKWATPLR